MLKPGDAAALAAEAMCDRRTVESYLSGGPVQPLTAARIERAARALGISLPVTPRPTGATTTADGDETKRGA